MNEFEGCQIPCLPRMASSTAKVDPQSLKLRIKRSVAWPWNYFIKKQLKKIFSLWIGWKTKSKKEEARLSNMPIKAIQLQPGDQVRVRSLEEIQATLNPWKEYKGCAFLPYMQDYCSTTQKVLQPVERFLDERDYKVKTCHGVVLLENVICKGTPVFGRCDRACHLFWRVEWLEKIEA